MKTMPLSNCIVLPTESKIKINEILHVWFNGPKIDGKYNLKRALVLDPEILFNSVFLLQFFLLPIFSSK